MTIIIKYRINIGVVLHEISVDLKIADLDPQTSFSVALQYLAGIFERQYNHGKVYIE